VSDDRIWQVKMPDGTVFVPVDSRPDNPRRSWIYARSTADEVARRVGGTVVEVTKRQKDSVLDNEIAFALNEPTPTAAKPPKAKTRTRPFGHTARKKIASAILENISLNSAARSALDTARDTGDDAEYRSALRSLKRGLPETLWVGYDPDEDYASANSVAPMWIDEDPQGEDPKHWMQIGQDEIAKLLVEDA
jgi:hypothetical protein